MSLSERFSCIKQFTISGLILGITLGHVDVINRLLVMRFEAFEIYQALAFPTLFFAACFLVLGIVGCLLPLRERATRISLSIAAAVFVIVVSGLLALKFEAYLPSDTESLLLMSLLTLTAALALGRTIGRALAALGSYSLVRSSASNYLFGVSIGVLVLFAFDISKHFSYSYRTNATFSLPHLAGKPPADRSLVVITLDTLRRDVLDVPDAMPFLQDLASRSMNFTNAIATSSWTLPSHASLFTGRYPHRHGAHREHQLLVSEETTLAELLSRHRFSTAGFIAGPYTKSRYGLAQGFQTYKDRLDFLEYRHTEHDFSLLHFLSALSPAVQSQFLHIDGERRGEELNAEVSRWLEELPSGEPYLLFLNYFDAHDPYHLGEEYRTLFATEEQLAKYTVQHLNALAHRSYTDLELRFEYQTVKDDEREALRALYLAEARKLDNDIRDLFDLLKAANRLDETLFIITSDHGEEFFEHGGAQHGLTLYEEVINIPLIIHGKSIPAEIRPERVSIVDIFPTALELLGIPMPSDLRIDGVSLIGGPHPESATQSGVKRASRYPIPSKEDDTAIETYSDSTWKHIHVTNPQGRIVSGLYNLKDDPLELNSKLDQSEEIAEKLVRGEGAGE